eukprot:225908-Amphidinium_carterae.1
MALDLPLNLLIGVAALKDPLWHLGCAAGSGVAQDILWQCRLRGGLYNFLLGNPGIWAEIALSRQLRARAHWIAVSGKIPQKCNFKLIPSKPLEVVIAISSSGWNELLIQSRLGVKPLNCHLQLFLTYSI